MDDDDVVDVILGIRLLSAALCVVNHESLMVLLLLACGTQL